MEADARLKSSPALLTDDDIDALDKYCGGADTYRRKRQDAIAAEVRQAAAREAARARAATPSRAPNEAELATLGRAVCDVEMTADGFQKALADLKHVVAHKSMPEILLWAVRAINKANAQRNEQLLAIEQEIILLKSTLGSIDKGGKGVNGVRWAGTHETGREYRSGELVTRN